MTIRDANGLSDGTEAIANGREGGMAVTDVSENASTKGDVPGSLPRTGDEGVVSPHNGVKAYKDAIRVGGVGVRIATKGDTVTAKRDEAGRNLKKVKKAMHCRAV